MANQLNPTALAQLIETMVGALPAGSAEETRTIVIAVIETMQPRDIVEAMFVARMIAAHYASMDGYRRALQPGIGDAEAVRLRNSAIAAGRSSDVALRSLEKRRAATEQPSHSRAATETASPVPSTRGRQPSAVIAPTDPPRPHEVPPDESGKPIALLNGDDKHRATGDTPGDAALPAFAHAEGATDQPIASNSQSRG
jgi:hypothetical protein